MLAKSLKDPTRANVAPKLPPIGRFIRAGEVAAAVAFLLSTDAGAITGHQLVTAAAARPDYEERSRAIRWYSRRHSPLDLSSL